MRKRGATKTRSKCTEKKKNINLTLNPSNASGLGALVSSPALLVTKTQSPGCWQMTQRSSSSTARRRSAHLPHDSEWPQRAMATKVSGSAQTAQHSSVAAMAVIGEQQSRASLCLRKEREQQKDATRRRKRKERSISPGRR